ncbi:MAG: hypothetical protein JWM78_2108 [Verrucomicrobiaceae bacterium]|nr:hypothetical protein [Verrucomicrobiaceae bacterium]
MDNLEVFENSFHHFVQAVEVMTLPPQEQCERMGHFNVAFEIKEDVFAGAYLTKANGCYLSFAEAAAITGLVESLKEIPSEVLSFTNIKEASLEKMKHPSWIPLRIKANNLLLVLTSAKAKNHQYFKDSYNEL